MQVYLGMHCILLKDVSYGVWSLSPVNNKHHPVENIMYGPFQVNLLLFYGHFGMQSVPDPYCILLIINMIHALNAISQILNKNQVFGMMVVPI